MIPWSTIKPDFDDDGSLLDLYVRGTTADDWTAVLAALARSGQPCEFLRAGEYATMPTRCEEAFADPERPFLAVHADGLTFRCHFFREDSIEFDLEPTQVSAETFRGLHAFMHLLATATGKPCLLTGENSPSCVILSMTPTGEVTHAPAHPSGSGRGLLVRFLEWASTRWTSAR